MDANKTQPPSEKSMVKSAKLVRVAGKYVEMEVEFNDGRGKSQRLSKSQG